MLALAAPDLSGNERKYLLEAFDSGYLTHAGVWEERFEKSFSEWIKRPSLATSSGTAALHIALMALGCGPGDEVIVPCLTFGATASVVRACGARPVLVDVDDAFCIDWNHVRGKLTRRTKAVIAVHLYGERCAIPKDYPVQIIEDSCEALGLVAPSGLAAFSFYGNKIMTTGEGGMLVNAPPQSRSLRDGGFTKDYDMAHAGLNYRMTNLQAAIGCAQLERIDDLIQKRLDNAAFYKANLEGQGKWLFVARVNSPVQAAALLAEQKIESRPVFKPLHMTQAFRQDGKFKRSENHWEHGLCLPTGPHVTREQQEQIVEVIRGT